MNSSKAIKRLILFPALLVGTLLILLVFANFLIRYNAKDILHELVARESNGYFDLKMQKITLSYSDSRIDIKGIRLNVLDSSKQKVLHVIKIPEFTMDLEDWGRLLFRKELWIDSLVCDFPEVEITGGGNHKKSELQGREVLLSTEIGDIYFVIRDIVNALQVKNLRIRRGGFGIKNPGAPNPMTTVNRINLGITNLIIDSTAAGSKGRFLFSDDIHVDASDQKIIFPDSLHFFNFRYLDISTKDKKILLDSCTIENISKEGNESSFNIFVDQIRLVNFDFNTLYESDIIKADSIYCSNPSIRVNLVQQERENTNSQFTEKVLKQLVGNMDVDYIGVINADLDLHAHGLRSDWSLSLSQNDFEIYGIFIDNKTNDPIRIDRVRLAFKNYHSYLADSLYTSTFDSVLLNESNLVVKNFKLNPVIEKNPYGHTVLIPEIVLANFGLEQLLFEDRLTATSVTFVDPKVEFKLGRPGNSKDRTSVNELSSLLDQGIDIGHLYLEKGTLKLSGNSASMPEVTIEDITGEIHPDRLLKARDVNSRLNAVKDLSFYSIGVRKGDIGIGLSGVEMAEGLSRLSASAIEVSDQQDRFMFKGNGVVIDGIQFNESTQAFSVDRFDWESGTAIFNHKLNHKEVTAKDTGSFYFGSVRLKNTRFIQRGEEGNGFQSFVSLLQARMLSKKGRDPAEVQDLLIKGNSLQYINHGVRVNAKEYDIRNDQLSSLSGVDISLMEPNFEIKGVVPQLGFRSDFLNSFLNHQTEEGREKPVVISYFKVDDGSFSVKWKNDNRDFSFKTNHASFQGDGIEANRGEFRLHRALADINAFYLENTGRMDLDASRAQVSMEVRDAFFRTGPGSDSTWKLLIVNFNLGDISLRTRLGESGGLLEADKVRTRFTNLQIDHGIYHHFLRTILKAPNFTVYSQKVTYPGEHFQLDLNGVETRSEGGVILTDSFGISFPKIRIDEVRESIGIHGYLQARGGNTILEGFDWERFGRDSSIDVENVFIENLKVNAGRLVPPNRPPDFVKPLPAKGWKRRKTPVSVHNLVIRNSNLDYEILDPNSMKTAHLLFSKGNLHLENLKNFNYTGKDTLKFTYSGVLKDSISVKVKYNENYQDSLSPFRFSVYLGPFDMSILNNLTVPLASVRIKSGIADTLHLEAQGNDYLAYGWADFHYHDLSVEILKKEEEKHRDRVKGLLSFIANNLLIKSNNSQRTGIVYTDRWRIRGIINYTINMLGSGLTTSLGVKSNNEMRRKYYRALKKYNLPTLK